MVTTHNPKKDTYYLGLGLLLIGIRSLLSSPWMDDVLISGMACSQRRYVMEKTNENSHN
jgi:hypothetical protein